jgi:hypothetical protein
VYMKNCFYLGNSPKWPILSDKWWLIQIIINYIFFSLVWDLKPYIVVHTIYQQHQLY